VSRILIHSNAPWMPTGYGVQTRQLMDQLTAHGHKVAVSAFSGLSGADIKWRGHLIMPSGQMSFGVDVLIPHMQRWRPDLTITLMDLWKLDALGDTLRPHNVAAWLPVDCSPMSRRDLHTLVQSGAKPIAMSRFGVSQISFELGGTDLTHYAPHAIDTAALAVMDDRIDYRDELGIEDRFVIGICAANRDLVRKSFVEQFEAFAQLNRKHDDTVLLVHTTPRNIGGLDLWELAHDLGILHSVRFTEQYPQDSGLMDTAMMRRWYSALDVLSACSYAEGFGLPLIEAQACGTPVITTNGSATAELVGPGRLVQGDPFWNPAHRAWWTRPRIPEITKAYLSAYNQSAAEAMGRRRYAREFALRYDSTTVYESHWEPIIKELTEHATA
jgi:glycosyltransferase involved in cell wall biosynthesis